jgi:hypothetical protein
MLDQILSYVRLIWFALITQSEHKTIPVPQTTEQGTQISEGKCKAVILRLNRFTRNDTAGGEVAATYFYYGDSQKIERECLRGESSDIIFCTDLNQVYVRNPFATDINIQILIYK